MDLIPSNDVGNRSFVSLLDELRHRPSTPSMLSSVDTPIQLQRAQSHDSGFVDGGSATIDGSEYVGIDDDDDKTTSIPPESKSPTIHLGREYHSYPGADAMEPVDFIQQLEWLAMEKIWHRQGLFLPPIIGQPDRILDVGTGSGFWAIMMADKYPAANVIGIDLAPVQAISVPPNCHFLLDDAEILPWYDTDDSLDIINVRQLHWVMEWPGLVRQAFRCLAPGGWFEWADLKFLPIRGRDSLYWRTWQSLQDSIYYWSRRSRSAHNMARMLEETGFVNIATRREYVLEGEDWELRKCIDIEGMTAPLHTVLGMKKEEIRPLVYGLKRELTDRMSAVRIEAIRIFARKPKAD